jgi:hypothetical protein
VNLLPRLCAALVLCILATLPLSAQVNAVVGGTVSDASGAVIPRVQVTATNVNTGIVTTRATNDTGNYEFPSLQPGLYTISASFAGFQTVTYTNLELGQGQVIRQNFSLQPAAAAQSVEVTAELDTSLATTTASVGSVLSDRTLSALPVVTRNVLDLVKAAPGVVTIRNLFGAEVPNFSGTATGQVNTTRDGLVTNDGRYNDSNGAYSAIFTSPDMVEEVRISTNTIDPSLGRGIGQVQLRTRAGANQFKGALFYTNNNSATSTLTWFDNLRGAQKPYANRNQYGGRLGGPILKNKAFFFVLIDNQRYLAKELATTTVLTETARQGVFRYLTVGAPGGTPRRNGNALSAFPSVDLDGNILTSAGGAPLFLNSFNVFSDVRDPNRTRIDPIWFSSQYLKRMPLPNDYTMGDGLNTAGFRWLRTQNGTDGATGQSPNTNRDHLTTRFDYQINDNHRLTYTMSREKNWGVTGQTGLPDFPAGYFGDVRRTPDFYSGAWTAVISPTILNEFRFGVKRDTWIGTSPLDKGCCFGAGENDLAESAKEARASYPSTSDGKLIYVSSGGLALGTYAPFGVAAPRITASPLKQFADTVTITKGSHSFQGGMEANYFSSEGVNSGNTYTTRPFVNLGVGNVPVPNITQANFRGLETNDIIPAQNLLANLAGTVASIQHMYYVQGPTDTDWSDYRSTYLFRRKHHQNDWAVYFKDTWKVSRSFTLTLGLRYDKYGTPYDSAGLGARPLGGESGLFGISGTSFANAMWAPGVASGRPTTTEFVGKNSPQPDKLIFNNDWNNLAPSVGFSWNLPKFQRATVLRGGYGINYAGATDFLGYSLNIASIPGVALNLLYPPPGYLDLARLPSANVLPVPTGGAKPFFAIPVDSPTGRSAPFNGYADGRRIPYVQNFNFSIQREVARNLTVDAAWIANKATKLWSNQQINENNIFENGFLDAFNITRAGGNAPLFDRLLMGINVTGAGVVNGSTLTGSQALRLFVNTNQLIANGNVGGLANFFNAGTTFTGAAGGLPRRAGLPENFFVANPQFASVNLNGNNSNSTYHSMRVTVTQRYAHGFSMQFGYVFSKTLGDTAINGLLRDPRNRTLSKGLAGNHRAHILNFNANWELPFGSRGLVARGAPGWAQQVIGGWQLSPFIQWLSGAPLTFTSALGTMGFRTTNTADLVGDFSPGQVRVDPNRYVEYFTGLRVRQQQQRPDFGGNTVVAGRFTNQEVYDASGNIILRNPQPGRTGNTAVNMPGLEGPGQLGFDLSLSKRIVIRETMSFTVRADVVDALNRPIWGNPVTDINSVSFGRITTALGNRTITFGARFDF